MDTTYKAIQPYNNLKNKDLITCRACSTLSKILLFLCLQTVQLHTNNIPNFYTSIADQIFLIKHPGVWMNRPKVPPSSLEALAQVPTAKRTRDIPDA